MEGQGRVGPGAIQEVVAIEPVNDCRHTMVVINCLFTDAPVKLAQANDVELWDGYKLASEQRRLLIGLRRVNQLTKAHTESNAGKQ